MSSFESLMALQQIDTSLTQLHHRRGHLPEHAETTELTGAIATIEAQTADARRAAHELQTRMTALEHDVHELDCKLESLAAQQFGSSARSPRELQAIEADIESIKRRRSDLEDTELALIEEFEPHDAAVRSADAQISETRVRIEQLAGLIGAAQGDIDREATELIASRASLVAQLDPAVLDRYERVRKTNRGIGAARLEHGTCQACRLKVPAVELDRIRHLANDVLVTCEECGAILVR